MKHIGRLALSVGVVVMMVVVMNSVGGCGADPDTPPKGEPNKDVPPKATGKAAEDAWLKEAQEGTEQFFAVQNNEAFAESKPLFDAVAKADGFVLYEGLPHPDAQGDLFEKEMKRDDVIEMHGEKFYAEPLKVSGEEAAKLATHFSDQSKFRAWLGPKKCGGFHSDYLAEWQFEGKKIQFLICFGCTEVKAFGLDKQFRCDMASDAASELSALLKPFKKNRPGPRSE